MELDVVESLDGRTLTQRAKNTEDTTTRSQRYPRNQEYQDIGGTPVTTSTHARNPLIHSFTVPRKVPHL